MAETPRKKTLQEPRSEAIAELVRPQTTKLKLDPQKSLADQVSISRNSHNTALDKGSSGE